MGVRILNYSDEDLEIVENGSIIFPEKKAASVSSTNHNVVLKTGKFGTKTYSLEEIDDPSSDSIKEVVETIKGYIDNSG